MAWFKCGGGGIPAALKSLMNAVLNKKWGTSGTYPPETWPETVNLMGPLEEKTVSGSVVSFSDGADDVPLKKCEVTIPANLTGVSSVAVVHGGYNFIDQGTAEFGNLNITTGNVDTSSQSWKTTDFMPLFAGDFFFTWVSSSTYFQVKWVAYDSNKSRIDGESTSTWTSVYSKQFTFPTGTAFVRFCWSVVVSGNPVTREDIRLNRGTVDLGYTDYVAPETKTAALGRTIYGGSVDIVNGTGTDKNVIVPFSDCTWSVVTSYQSNFNADNGIISLRFGKNNMSTAGYAQTVDGVACNVFSNNNRSVWNNASRLNEIGYTDGITVNILYSDIGLSEWTSNSADTLAAWRSSQLYLTGVFSLVKATPEALTFPAVPVNSLLDDNTLWSDAGNLEVVYRSTGTETIIPPVLVTKTITENGTYTAAADAADGFSSVTVNVPTGATNIETVLGSNALLELTGVSGTDVTRTMWTRTAAQDEKVVFHPNTQVKTNTGANDGYFKVLKNDVVVVSTYANTSTTTSLSIPDIDLEAGDVLTISAGFDNNHSSCWFDLYSTITILSSGSVPVLGLGLGNPGPVNEPEQEEEPDAAPEEIQEETPEEVDQNESNE